MALTAAKWIWCLCIAGWALASDLKRHKIRNHTAAAGIVGGLLLNAADLKPALIGMLLPLLLIVLFAAHMMGAGDIKLLSAIGAILCFPDIVNVVLYSFVFCGLHILLRAAKKHQVRALFRALWQDFLFFLLARQLRQEYPENEKLPMAGAIAVALLVQIAKQIFIR